jgi:hypothetical protein
MAAEMLRICFKTTCFGFYFMLVMAGCQDSINIEGALWHCNIDADCKVGYRCYNNYCERIFITNDVLEEVSDEGDTEGESGGETVGCLINCAGRVCGPDGCGGICGECDEGEDCEISSGVCIDSEPTCTPDCSDRECGPDPVCGLSCGTCSGSEVCDDRHQCVCVPKTCQELNYQCGEWPDGCGGPELDCGVCNPGRWCTTMGWCVPIIEPGCDSTNGVYVDANAAPGGTGLSPDSPVVDLHEALDLAGGERSKVCVIAGDYAGPTLIPRDGVSIFAGYAPGFRERTFDRSTYTSTEGRALVLSDCITPTVISGLGLRTPDTAPGVSSVAVVVDNCRDLVHFEYLVIASGRGGRGEDGMAGATGPRGADGQDAFETSGGAGGESPGGEPGGRGADGRYREEGLPGEAGAQNDSPTAGSPGSGSGATGMGCFDGSVLPGGRGGRGGDGNHGGHGMGGLNLGTFVDGGWIASRGEDGAPGGVGGSGGGGGAGAGEDCWPWLGTGQGGGGGAGGGGGGQGGTGGAGGGASIGLVIIDSSVTTLDVEIRAEDGGDGGQGGAASVGGLGGRGGSGAPMLNNQSQSGGDGGDGGLGGAGGCGGGGGGGPSIAALGYGDAELIEGGARLIHGYAGRGGRSCAWSGMDGAANSSVGVRHCDPHGTCSPAFNPPEGLIAQEEADYIDLAWSATEGATGYVVYRDGEEIARTSEPEYRDAMATPPPTLPPPLQVEATSSRSDMVLVNWLPIVPKPGEMHAYSVSAVFDSIEGPRAPRILASRSPYPVLGYRIRVAGGAWLTIGTTLSFGDVDAPLGSIASASITASEGTSHSYVQLHCTVSTAPGPLQEYFVKGFSDMGPGEVATAAGRRVVGTLHYTWLRSQSSSDSSYRTITTTTANSYQDTGAPSSGAARFYRCSVSSMSASNERESEGASGYRATCSDGVRNGDETGIDCGGSCPPCQK